MTRTLDERAEHAAAMCEAYRRLVNGRPDDDLPGDLAADLITDLLHLIKTYGVDPLDKLETAKINYEAEQAGEE